MPSSYHRDYANAVSNIYQGMGQAQANARLQQGQAWGNAFGQIGQAAAAIPGQLQEMQQQKVRNELTALQMDEVRGNLARAKQKDEQTMAIANLIGEATVNGQFDQQAFTAAASAKGLGHIVPEVIKTFAESQRALLELEDAQKRGQITDAKLVKLQQDYLRPFAIQLWENKFDPTVVNGTFAALKAQGVPPQTVDQWESMPPEQFITMVQTLLPRAQAPEPVTLSEGQVRLTPKTDTYGRPLMGADGQPLMNETKGPEKSKTLDQMIADAARAGNSAEVRRLVGVKAQEAAATRAPQQDSFTSKRVLKQDGTVGPAIFNSRTGQFYDPQTRQVLPNAAEVTESGVVALENKGKLAAIVSRMNELSERINVNEGVLAAARGAAAQQAAKVNLDNDVAEYEALVSVYTPIVARANGHTGVLTQIDVDSTKAGFPSPRDSKSLRDRKVKIMTTIQGAGNLSGTSQTAPADKVWDPVTKTWKSGGR